MKKFFKFLVIALLILMPFSFVITPSQTASALSVQEVLEYSTYGNLLSFIDYGASSRRIARMAGSSGEVEARDRIQIALDNLATNVTPVDNNTTLNGIQMFSFYNQTDGKKEVSYNVIYKVVGRNSQKKVVLTCNYDNYFEPYIEHYKNNINPSTSPYIQSNEQSSEGVNASAASVAVLLTLAEYIEEGTLDYDIEFVFFGAGYQNNAGANYYIQTLSQADREATLLIVDVSKIAFGSNIYYYSGEFGSSADKFFDKTMSSLTRYKSNFYGASIEADTPLGYTNAGYSGASVIFSDSGLNFLHIFAGDYNNGVVGGECEYYGLQNVTNTAKDSHDYIPEENLLINLGATAGALYNLVCAEGFEDSLSQRPNMTAYKVFTNTYVAAWLPVFILIVLLLVSIIVHYYVANKTLKYASDHNISGIMITIDQDDEDKKEE